MQTESGETLKGLLDVKEVIDLLYNKTNQKYGTDIKPDVGN